MDFILWVLIQRWETQSETTKKWRASTTHTLSCTYSPSTLTSRWLRRERGPIFVCVVTSCTDLTIYGPQIVATSFFDTQIMIGVLHLTGTACSWINLYDIYLSQRLQIMMSLITHIWTDVLGLRTAAATHTWRRQRKMVGIIIILFSPFPISFGLTSSSPRSPDGHMD